MNLEFNTHDIPFRDVHDHPAWIRMQQVRLLFSNCTITMLGTLFCAFTLVVLLWPVVPQHRLVLWLEATALLTLGRLFLQQRFAAEQNEIHDPERWMKLFLAGVLASGALWGSASIWIFPSESITHQVYVAFVLSGICAGAA